MKKTVIIAATLALSCAGSFAQSDTAKADPTIATATAYVRQLREQMRDPDSFVFERAFIHVIEPLTKEAAKRMGKRDAAKWADRVGTIQYCFEYRSRNGYGGMNRGVAAALNGILIPYEQGLLDLVGGTCAGVWADGKGKEITTEVRRSE
jgi:hypothetical protein